MDAALYNIPSINSHTALLICDVQKGFVQDSMAHLPDAARHLQKLYPCVIATRFYNEPGSPFRRWSKWGRFAKESDDFSLAFEPLESTHVLDKAGYSCVTPAFLSLLDKYHIDTVHIMGADTNMCVFITASDLFQGGRFRPVVLLPYCASHSGAEYHEAAIKLLEKSVGAAQLWQGGET